MLAVALLILVPFAFLLAPSDVISGSDTAAGAAQYSYDNLFKSGTVFNDRAISYPLAQVDQADAVRDMVGGDLNSDGITDVAVASETKIIIYYGAGNGALGSSFTVPVTMTDLRRLAVGDLDGDGKADIAATYYDAASSVHRIGIFYQKDGFSTPSSQHPDTYYDPWQVLIGDFVGTGANGLAVICRGDSSIGEPSGLMVFKSPYTGVKNQVFVPISGLTNLRLMASGLVNDDDRPDLVAGDAYGSSIVVLTQPATSMAPWSSATLDLGGSIADLMFMDYSGSGKKKDLVVVKDGVDPNQIEVRLTGGSVPVTPSRYLTFDQASAVAVGPVTGGSFPDLIVLSGSSNRARLYPHQGSGLDSNAFDQFPVNTGPIKAVAVSNGVYVLASGSTGTKPTVEFYRYVDGGMSNADVNSFVNDGQLTAVCAGDVSFGILAAAYSGQNAVYVSSASETRRIDTSSVPTGLFIGDLDGDSVGDLAIAFQNSNSVSIYKGSTSFMSNNAPVSISLPSPLTMPQSLTGGRIGAIAKDVLVVGCKSGIDVIFGPLSGSPVHEVIGTGGAYDRIDVGFGALDPSGAGSAIAALNEDTRRVEVYFLKQSPVVGDCYDATQNALLLIPESGTSPNSIAVGDFDGNGRDDVAATTNTNQIKIFSNTGSGFSSNSQPAASVTMEGIAGQVRSGDLNDDGRDDLAVRYSSIAEIGIWLSRGSLSFSNSFDLAAGGPATGVAIADINGDRREDIAASSSTAEALSYWLQRDLIPDANIWYSAGTLDVGGTVSFDGSNSTDSASDISSLAYLWNFGDGNTSDQKVVRHSYTSEGDFSGSLTVTDRSGLTDKVDFQVTVNKPMEVRIEAYPYNPLKNETIHLRDVSDVPNGVSSRFWDLGDGRNSTERDVDVKYAQVGLYNITLTVTDIIGHTKNATIMISVVPGANTIEGLIANGGGTSFYMDEEILFEVKSSGGGAPIAGFQWDLNYNESMGFNPSTGITINQTTWSYHDFGERTICVRNYNFVPYAEEKLTIYIMNARPVAVISASSESWGNFTFDAVGSWDTPTDNSTLSYRWNFGEISGWTNWSSETRITKNYTADGRYNVILEVKDQHGLINSTTYQAIVDNSPPTINLDSAILSSQAYRGEDLVIKVNVTDVSDDVERVLLIYTTNNETKTLAMTRVSGTDTYVATIPAKDLTGDLSFYIEAVDGDGHHTVTAAMGISLVDRPTTLWMFIVIAAIAVLAVIFLLYYRARMVVDDVFIIYHDGNLMAHQTRRLKPGMDDQILGSMLVAIQEFVKDSFKDEASTGLNRMDFGEKKVLVEKGEHIYLAVVLHGKREGRVPHRMKETISKAESDYFQALDEWDGDLEKVRGIKDETDPLLKTGLKDLMSSMPFARNRSVEAVEMTTCPYCGNSYPAGEPKCPKCGTAPETKAPGGGADGTGGPAA